MLSWRWHKCLKYRRQPVIWRHAGKLLVSQRGCAHHLLVTAVFRRSTIRESGRPILRSMTAKATRHCRQTSKQTWLARSEGWKWGHHRRLAGFGLAAFRCEQGYHVGTWLSLGSG